MSYSITLGEKCKLYYSATLATSTTYTIPASIASEVSSVQVTAKVDTPEYTTRANGGVKQYAASLKDLGVTFEIIKTGDATLDAGISAFRTAYQGGSEIGVYVLDGASGTSGSEGPCGNWIVSDFSRDESNGAVVKYKIELKPSSFNAWHVES